MKGLQSLDALLARKNQRFVCTDTGWPEPGPERFTANSVHHTDPPLGKAELERLGRLFGEIPQLQEFYSRYGSVRLYADTIGFNSAFYIATPDEWHRLQGEFQSWLDICDDDEEVMPDDLDDYIVIGDMPATGNSYLMPTSGPHTGKVFLFDHDGFEFSVQGQDLSAFLEHNTTVDEALLDDIGGHTRYSDGETETQWLPESYHYDD